LKANNEAGEKTPNKDVGVEINESIDAIFNSYLKEGPPSKRPAIQDQPDMNDADMTENEQSETKDELSEATIMDMLSTHLDMEEHYNCHINHPNTLR
jgi:hypothetical protein